MMDSLERNQPLNILDKVSSGIAAEDLADNSVVLTIISAELQPQSTYGEIGVSVTKGSVSLTDRDGRPLSAPVQTSNHVVATWAGENNRRYPPMVKKGEPVKFYKRSGQDKFFWEATGSGRDFRKIDRLHIEVAAADPTKPSKAKDDTNTYTVGVDPTTKKVFLKTSKDNGEPVAFSVEFDTQAGTFHLTDDTKEPGNRLYLDTGVKSGVPTFQINLSTGTTIKAQKEDLLIQISGKMLLSAKDRIVFDSPLTVFNKSKAGIFIINAKSMAFNAAKDIILNPASVLGLNAVSTKVSGVLIAAAARIANAVKGPASGSYKGPSVSDPLMGNAQDTSNAPDVSVAGVPYRAP